MLVFDVTASQPINIADDEFILTVGDVVIGSGSSGYAAEMAGVVGRTVAEQATRIYHNRLEQNYPNPFNQDAHHSRA